MSDLTQRQRIKTNAALALIALHGYNPRTVQNAAKANIAKGDTAPVAYTKALNAFADSVPALRTSLEVAIELVGKSDDATLAKYDAALSHYNATGDDSQLEALAPMIIADANALAVMNGEAEAGSALFEDIQAALGIDEAAFAAEPFVPNPADIAPQEAPAQASSFEFANAAKPAASAPAAPAQAKGVAQHPAGMVNPAQSRSSCGYRATPTGEQARREQGTPMGDIQYTRTATGAYRPVPTGEAARREAGVPLGPDA